MKYNFLLSPAWEKFQQALGRQTFRVETDEFAFLAVLERSFRVPRLYLPYGPVLKKADCFTKALAEIEKIAREHDAWFIRIEPTGVITNQELTKAGFQRVRHVQPADTIINDVSDGKDAILARMSQSVRRVWRKNEKAGTTFAVSYNPKDMELFLSMIHAVSDRTGMHPHTDGYFRILAETLFPSKTAGLLIAKNNNEPIAAIVFFNDCQTMYYAHAGSYTEYRKLSPATALGVYALLFAHEQGCKCFDFWGIAPDNAPADHPWQGFTQFKKAFGGTPKHYVGTWEKPLRPLAYKVYLSLTKIKSSFK